MEAQPHTDALPTTMAANKSWAAHGLSQEIIEEICARIMDGESVRQICMLDYMPSSTEFYRQLQSDEYLRENYVRAKEAQADKFAEELLDIADNSTNDWIVRENERGGEAIVLNAEALARSKLRYEARRWLMGKMKPKKYGDKQNVEVSHTGTVMHLTADVSATLRFLGGTIENEPAAGITDISDAVPD